MTRRRTTSQLGAGLAAGALAVTALVVLGGAVEPAAAAGLRIPKHATIVIRGHGFGHGRGMSQYGAEGAARQGLSAKKIVQFYYPHTRGGTFRGKVRVLISADTDQNTTVVNRSGLTVHDLGDGGTFAVPTSGKKGQATRWRLSSSPGEPAEVSYLLSGTWHVWRTLSGDGEFRAKKPLSLVLPSGPTPYRGVLQSRTSTRGGSAPHRITVNKVSMEDYVRAVVPSEAIPSWHQAALRAQAIAARSYAAYKMQQPLSDLYELCDTSACQVYGGVAAEYPSTDEATSRTTGRIRTYQGRPALTEFSSSNGGFTVASSLRYQVAKPDPYDGWAGNPNHSWTTKISDATVEKQWPGIGNLQKIRVLQRTGDGQWNGRIEQLELLGSRGSRTLTGDEFRLALTLRSTWLSFSVK
jgi:SpoIID/LytB domain protein